MNETNNVYTAASLAAMPERELDALAHELVFSKRVVNSKQRDEAIMSLYEIDAESVPRYSTDLNHTALLERELSRRGNVYVNLYERNIIEIIGADERDNEYISTFQMLTVAAKQRTIAAILAAINAAKVPNAE